MNRGMSRWKLWNFKLWYGWQTHYTGIGYDKGLGFNILVKVLELEWNDKSIFKTVKDFEITTE